MREKTVIIGAFVCGMAFMAAIGNGPSRGANAEEEGSVEKEFINPTTMGFTNVVTVKSGGAKTIYVSGQVGYGDGGIPDTIEEQADLAFKNLVAELEAAGAGVEDVVKTNTYIKEMDGPKTQAVGQAKAKYFTQENQPASTWVGVTSLVYPQLLVEVEAIAVVDAD